MTAAPLANAAMVSEQTICLSGTSGQIRPVGDNADPALLIECRRRVLADVWSEHIRITNHLADEVAKARARFTAGGGRAWRGGRDPG